MTELEQALTALAAEIEWPETPAFELRLGPAPAGVRRPWRRRALVLALAAAALAIGIAFAVSPARSAILRFLHLRGVTIERVSTLPAAEERPLTAGLGAPITPEAAALVLGRPVVLPPTAGKPRLYQTGGVVSALLATPDPVLVSELDAGSGGALLK